MTAILFASRLEKGRPGIAGLLFLLACLGLSAFGQSDLPRPVGMTEETLGRKPWDLYGSLQETIETMRAYRPLDLNSEVWQRANPGRRHAEWAQLARELLRSGLHYDLPPVDLNAVTLARIETDTFIREKIEFNSTPWFRVPGYLYIPKNVPLPAPALIVMHEWGGPLLFGADRVCGEPVHPVIAEHRATYTGGRALADWFAAQGYVVIAIDAYHFGKRAPRGISVTDYHFGRRGPHPRSTLPESYDPAKLDEATFMNYDETAKKALDLALRQLMWAGTTWAGVNYGDDSRCIDYLLSRTEVDPDRIGCTGLSGGGWRTNILAALDPRIKAAVSVGWMTTGDAQQAYAVNRAIGPFNLLPGVWGRIDVPDLIAMAAPKAIMVENGTEDTLFPPLGKREAARQIANAYAWAGVADNFRHYTPAKKHVYDAEVQAEALAWFDLHLKKRRSTVSGVSN